MEELGEAEANSIRTPLRQAVYLLTHTIPRRLATGIRRRKCFIRIQKLLLEFKSAWMQTVDVLDLDRVPLETNISLNNILKKVKIKGFTESFLRLDIPVARDTTAEIRMFY